MAVLGYKTTMQAETAQTDFNNEWTKFLLPCVL